jgi:hypothetical protein
VRTMPLGHALVEPRLRMAGPSPPLFGRRQTHCVEIHHCVGFKEALIFVSGRVVSSRIEDSHRTEIGPTSVLLHVGQFYLASAQLSVRCAFAVLCPAVDK